MGKSPIPGKGPNKKAVTTAARQLQKKSTPKPAKTTAAETLDYRKEHAKKKGNKR